MKVFLLSSLWINVDRECGVKSGNRWAREEKEMSMRNYKKLNNVHLTSVGRFLRKWKL